MRKPAAEIIADFVTSAKEGKQPLAIFTNLNSPTLVEVLGAAGHRVIMFDLEHTSTNPETLVSLVRAAELHDMMVMVRLDKPDSYAAIRALDAGVHGIWVQHMKSADEVRAFVDALRYPPIGDRNYCTYPRANENGIGDILGFIEYSNTHPLVIVGLNNEEALEELPEMLTIEGVAGFCTNASDIIVRTGYGEYDDFFQIHNIAKAINKTIHDAGKLVMSNIFAPDMDDLEGTRKFLAEATADIWFTADIGCFLMGLSKFRRIQRALVDDRANGTLPASTSETGKTDEGDRKETSGDDKDKEGMIRTC